MVYYPSHGEMSEWFKELVLKTSDSARNRGFESHSLRHKNASQMFLTGIFLYFTNCTLIFC